MPRVFIPVESVSIAHAVRPLQVARHLQAYGTEVIFGASDRYRPFIENAGFEVRPLYNADPEMLLDCVRRVEFSRQNACLPDYLKSDMEGMKKIGDIDLVISDFRFMARFAAEALGIPHAALVNGFFTPYYSVVPLLPRAIMPGMPEWVRKNPFLRKMVKQIVPRVHSLPYKKICRKNGIKSEINSGFDFSVSDSLTLICDMPEFTPQKNLPAHYHFVGPILWEPEDGYDRIPPEFEGSDRPIIYVSVGTSGLEEAFKVLIRTLGHLPYNIILSTAENVWDSLPPNVVAIPYVKPSAILKHTSLMICHGGNGTIYQALEQGVPVMCVPSFYDQEWNSHRVKDLGLGDLIFCSDLSPIELEIRIRSLIHDPVVQRKVKLFQSRMRLFDGARMAAEHIMELLNRKTVSKTAFFA